MIEKCNDLLVRTVLRTGIRRFSESRITVPMMRGHLVFYCSLLFFLANCVAGEQLPERSNGRRAIRRTLSHRGDNGAVTVMNADGQITDRPMIALESEYSATVLFNRIACNWTSITLG